MAVQKQSVWQRLVNGEVIDMRRISNMTRPPKEVREPHWKEIMMQKNRENIRDYFLRKGYEEVLIERRWNGFLHEYESYLCIDGYPLLLVLREEEIPIWRIATIEKVLANHRRQIVENKINKKRRS